MTTLDFVETLRVLMPDADIKDTTNAVKFYEWAVHNTGLSVKVRGRIPYEVAMTVFENYPCEKLGIRVGSVGLGVCPTEFLTDDIYESESNKCFKDESIDSKMQRLDWARSRLKSRSNKGKYLEMYRIDTKEGLVVVLNELRKYYAKPKRRNSKPKMQLSAEEMNITEMITKINIRIIERIQPWTSIHSWMLQGMAVTEYLAGWNRFKSNPVLHEFRRALNEFDRVVNPFVERDLSMEEIVRDLQQMKIQAYPFRYGDRYENELSFYDIHIDDTESKCSVQFGIRPVGFYYNYWCVLGEHEFIGVSHFYDTDSKEENRGEILDINYYCGSNIDHERSVRLNLTKGTIGEKEKTKKSVSEMELGYIYLELVKATKMAADVTINNFNKNKTFQMS